MIRMHRDEVLFGRFFEELDDSKMMAVMSISKIGQLSKANCPAT